MNEGPATGASTCSGDLFATTRWTVVIEAGGRRSADADVALEELCSAYWFPLYAYVRRRGYSKEDAEDLTQGFFSRFLERNYLDGLSAERGRFRAFLLAALKHFLANEWDKAQTLKRGGQWTHLSLDWQTADTRFQVAASDQPGPDQAYDREWALTLLERVIHRLEAEADTAGKGPQFAVLKGFLTTGGNAISYPEVAGALGMEHGAARVAVHRLRKRYREVLRAEVGRTLADPMQADAELRALFAAFR
jgi:RNA polymerase sigma-70 factor (ECF subfamily)